LPIKQEIKGFSTFLWDVWSYDIFLKFSRLIFKWETKFSLGILWSNPISSTLFGDQTLEIYFARKGKTLKSQLLKKLSIKFFESQDLSA
jgi:hypothetical protein